MKVLALEYVEQKADGEMSWLSKGGQKCFVIRRRELRAEKVELQQANAPKEKETLMRCGLAININKH